MQTIETIKPFEEDNFGEGSLQDLKKIEKIGSGTYGIVYKCMHRKTKEIVALKKMILEVILFSKKFKLNRLKMKEYQALR